MVVAAGLTFGLPAPSDAQDVDTRPGVVDSPAAGGTVVEVRVVGNRTVGDTEILNAIRTAPGRPFEPDVVAEDYRRIFDLRRFRRVDARYEQTPRGVIVVFEVEEQDLVGGLVFRGNRVIREDRLRELVELETGRSFDPLLLASAQTSVEQLYRNRGHALAEVRVSRDDPTGVVVFDITEGPRVVVRNIDFLGARSFSESQLRRQVSSNIRWPLALFRPGRFDPRLVDEDVGQLQRFYRARGFFDARVGRRIVFSPDQREVQIEFLIDEGPRYRVREIRFEGNRTLDDAQLARAVRLQPGEFFDQDRVELSRRDMVRAYSPFGFIFVQPSPGLATDPDYLTISETPLFDLEPGELTLVFQVNEGRPFLVGRIEVRGNDKTRDKVILRQFDLAPGDLYDSDAVARGANRLRALRYFGRIDVNPVGDAPDERNLLIEVEEERTASINFGGAVSSNGGLSGSIVYEQRNFDLFDPPGRVGDFLTGNAFSGGGQNFRIMLEPGTERSSASVSFFEPYFYDQNLGFGTDLYYRQFRRREFSDDRGGGRLRLVPRVGRDFFTQISLRAEDVRIRNVREPRADRAPEILEFEGSTTLTGLGFDVGFSRIDNPVLPARGLRAQAGAEAFGLVAGPSFQRVTGSVGTYLPLYRDLTDRPVIWENRLDVGFGFGDPPFFERFYGGGTGSIRGFRFRGVSPRDGLALDAVGGDFNLTGSSGLSFPLAGQGLRGVVFSDFGTVESNVTINDFRVSAGFGLRINLNAFGNVPVALDFAWPINASDLDERQIFSFSLGFLQ